MDRAQEFGALQRLREAGRLPVRVTYNLPYADLRHAERMGVRSGWGDAWLRIWGVKAFLDGSLGTRTAEMLDGSGVTVLEQPDLIELCRRCAAGHLNVALHAIGDRAVRRALDALEPLAGAWRWWRPRIEHAQCVHPDDWPRFKPYGVIASMQPFHAVSDRELADREWQGITGNAYAWGALERAGARLAFGSDAPVETADPLAGMDAATHWRQRAEWHPGLALSHASTLRAYTLGAAYAVGQESVVGRLRPGFQCDLTVVAEGRVTATVAGGRVTFRARR
jgi:predicted amidohydrolase YtcJ